MDSPDRNRSYVKRDNEDSSDVRGDRIRDDDEWESTEKRKHRSGRSRKLSNGEDADAIDGSGRRRSSGGDRSDSRKRSGGGSSRVGSDDDDYETRKDLRSKQLKRKQEESSLEKLSSWYQDGDLETKQGGEKSGCKGHSRPDESERRKITSKIAEHEGSSIGSKNKEERFHDGEQEKAQDRESKHSDRRESSREKVHGSTESGRISRRRWDDSDAGKRSEEVHHEKADLRSGKGSDSRHESLKEKSVSARNEPNDSKTKGLDPSNETGVKSNNKEDRRGDGERNKSKNRSEVAEEEDKSPATREDRSTREKNEKAKQQRTPISRDAGEVRERSSIADEDGNTGGRDKSAKEVGRSNRSKTPEKSVRRHPESQHSELEYERSSDNRRKDFEKDGHKDDRTKGRDDFWGDRSRDRESSKDSWKRRQSTSNDREAKDGDVAYDRGRDWEPRHARERNDNERPHGRTRGEAVKTSSNFGISNENYDVIEIQTKPLDFGRPESASNFARRSEHGQQSDGKSGSNAEEWAHMRDERVRRLDIQGSSEDTKERFNDDSVSWRDEMDYQAGKGRGQRGAMSGRGAGGQSSSGGSQTPYGNQDSGSFSRNSQQGVKGSRIGRGGRGRPAGRDNQQVPLPLMGSPFGPIGIPPPGPMQPLGPSMSPAPGPLMTPGVIFPPFSSPVIWPGARGVEMNMLGMPPALSPVPPGPSAPRFPPSMGNPSNPAMFFNQAGSGRGMPPNMSGPSFNPAGLVGRGTTSDKTSGGWIPPRNSGPPGKAPSRGEQNDYSQNFVDTGMRPQNFIRELELTNVVEDYPKLRELIQKKDEIVTKSASAPMYLKGDLREFELSPELLGTKFDVILVDPPWEEYVHRAPGVADHMEYWTFEEILNLKIEAIADTPSFIFLWVGDGVGLEQGRQCLKKWGFRRCEDICWVKTNKSNATPGLRHDSHTLFQHSKEHCLMGIKGTVRRSTDGHIIHANIDTDVIIAEEPPYGSTQKPEDMYRIIEHFSLGRRRLELFGEDHNIRAGWLTVGKELSSSNFNAEAYVKGFADKDGKVWQGGGGRNPPPEAPHLVITTPEIEALRPKSPMKNQQQQQSASISLTTASSSNRRTAGNSPQNPNTMSVALNQEASSSNPSTPAPWAPPMEGIRGREGGNMPAEDKVFDMYGYGGPANGDYLDFESHRAMNLL
ncbi:N6-adenosine-methyltransferase non-catalytic subunit MTB [Mercurialis annua]|uniref:N6-adenosine-methyltransferase non-catalytic subunit MTB n=1 Tax=Mercurialis annua TaxID=3986 RepID=UPI002160E2E5|nr:N6-adenosine-methyltransferase non-catalytic subunit MTB [Mercurialis annua]